MDHELKKEFYSLLKNDESVFKYFKNNFTDGVWFAELNNNSRVWQDTNFWKTFGYTLEEVSEKNINWTDIINQDDLVKVNELLAKHLNDRSIPFDIEVRYNHKDGQVIWIKCQGFAFNDIENCNKILGIHTNITKDKNSEFRLLKELNFCNKVFNVSNIGLFEIDFMSKSIFFNNVFINQLGYNLKEIGQINYKSIFNLIGKNELKSIVNELKNKKREFEKNVKFIKKDKSFHWFLARGIIAEKCLNGNLTKLSGSLVDINDLMISKEQLRHKIDLEKILNNTTSQLINTNSENINDVLNICLKDIGEFTNSDRTYIFQLSDNDEYLNNTHEWCKAGIEPQIEFLQNLAAIDFKYTLNTLNKIESFYYYDVNDIEDFNTRSILLEQQIQSILLTPIHKDEKLLGFMGFDSVLCQKFWSDLDIYALKSLSHIIGSSLTAIDIQNKLVEAKNAALESDKLKSAFLATINHELRTPLHHIIGFSEVIQDTAISNDSKYFSNIINNSSKYLLSIIEDIYDLALLESNQVKIRNTSFKIIDFYLDLKKSLVEILEKSGKSENINLTFSPDTNKLIEYIVTDKYKISQVLVNLFKNAVKFTEEGEINFGFKFYDRRIVFMVRDTGIGIDNSQIENVFKFFRQIDDSVTRIYGGIGLGLAISKRISEVLNATINIESKLKEGTTVYFEIPIEIEEYNTVLNEDPIQKNNFDFSDIRILVVEDNQESAVLLNNILSSANANYLNANTGIDAIKILESSDNNIDIILLDYKLPDSNGLLLSEKILKINPKVKIIITTAFQEFDFNSKALKAGCSYVFYKPIEKNTILLKINEIVLELRKKN